MTDVSATHEERPAVLVVEDTAAIADLLERLLTDAGYACLGPLRDTRSAHALLERRKPDAAVLDFELGGETAASLADRLRDRGVGVLFITGYPIELLPERFREVCIEKPFSTAAFERRVRTVVYGCGGSSREAM